MSDIETVLAHYGWDLPNLRGGWQSIKCGAHKDSHASCRINPDDNRVMCLACQFGGDIYDVIQHYEQKGFKDALARAEEILGTGGGHLSRSAHGKPNGSRLPRRQGNHTGHGGYVPPRLRRQSS